MGRIFRFPINGALVEINPAVLASSIGLYEAAFRRELEYRGAFDLANLAVTLALADGVPLRAMHVDRAVRALLSRPAERAHAAPEPEAPPAGAAAARDLFGDA
jgi:hypothetical protein